jgi:hypothetical protein
MHSAPTHTVRSIVSAALTASLATLGVAAGCADPQGSLDDFTERDCASKEQPFDQTGCAKIISAGGCEPPAPGEADGRYLFVISASLLPSKPVLFQADITTTAATNGIDVTMVLDGISKEDRQTPLGDPNEFPSFFVDADGQFSTDETEFNLPGEANAVTGNDALVSLTLQGRFCKEDLSCGALNGVTIMPAGVMLDGSTFTIMKAPEGEPFPDPLLDCEGTPAGPL